MTSLLEGRGSLELEDMVTQGVRKAAESAPRSVRERLGLMGQYTTQKKKRGRSSSGSRGCGGGGGGVRGGGGGVRGGAGGGVRGGAVTGTGEGDYGGGPGDSGAHSSGAGPDASLNMASDTSRKNCSDSIQSAPTPTPRHSHVRAMDQAYI